MKSTTALLLLAAAGYTKAQQPAWAQCGGQGWTGGTTCVAGYACTYANSYYSQCIPGSTTPTGPSTPSTTTTAPTATNGVCPGKLTKFKFFGANQSGAEWGDKVPGTENYDFVFPAPSSVDYLMGKGMNTFRIPFMVERLALPSSGGLTGSFNPTYLASLQSIVNYVTNTKGGYAIVDPHNYMRYNGNIITSTADFATFWKNLATVFKSNSRVIFDIMNEPYGIDASVVFSLNQAAVNAIRAAGASQLVIVEGTMWTGAGSWVSSGNGAAFKALKDPGSNIAIEMHQYLNDDGSGSSPICVSTTIAAERLAGATQWLKDNNFKGFLGEIGGGSNDVCIAAIKGGLCAMQQSGVWIGVTWWSAGPWWGNATMSIEPPNGAAISRVLPEALMPFM